MARRPRAHSRGSRRIAHVLAASERAQQSTLTVASYLTTDIRLETALHGKEASLAPLVERFEKLARRKSHLRCADPADAARLRELLSNYNLQLPIFDEPIDRVSARADFAQAIVCGHLNQGFRLPEARLVFVTFDEIFGTRKRQPPRLRPNVIRAIF